MSTPDLPHGLRIVFWVRWLWTELPLPSPPGNHHRAASCGTRLSTLNRMQGSRHPRFARTSPRGEDSRQADYPSGRHSLRTVQNARSAAPLGRGDHRCVTDGDAALRRAGSAAAANVEPVVTMSSTSTTTAPPAAAARTPGNRPGPGGERRFRPLAPARNADSSAESDFGNARSAPATAGRPALSAQRPRGPLGQPNDVVAVPLPDRRGRRRNRHEQHRPVAMDAPGDDPRQLVAERAAQPVPALFLVLEQRGPDGPVVGGERERRRQARRLGVGPHPLRPHRGQRGDAGRAQRGRRPGRATARRRRPAVPDR